MFLNVSDQVKDGCYQNGPEWLHADLTRLDGLVAVRPYIWAKQGPGFDDAGNGIEIKGLFYGEFGQLGHGNTGNIGDDEYPSDVDDVGLPHELSTVSPRTGVRR